MNEFEFATIYPDITKNQLDTFFIWCFHAWYKTLAKHNFQWSNDQLLVMAILYSRNIENHEVVYNFIKKRFRYDKINSILEEIVPERVVIWNEKKRRNQIDKPQKRRYTARSK